jgi:glycerol-1-phosphate dehydrogenase [NAD(P)+]
MCQAPMRMLWAGLGDMIAKYVSVCEWRIANLIIGEEYCEEIAGLMRASVKKIVDNAHRLSSRDPEAIQAVADGLVMSGVAMSFALSSRPASGLEHTSPIWG